MMAVQLFVVVVVAAFESGKGVLLHLFHRERRWVFPGELGGVPVHVLSENAASDQGGQEQADPDEQPFVVVSLLVRHSLRPGTWNEKDEERN